MFLTILSTLNQSFAQKQGQELIDSLQTVLKNYDAKRTELNKTIYDKGDTIKIKILIDLSWKLINTGDYTLSKQYADEALAISQKIGFKKGTANAYGSIGVIYRNQGEYPNALKNCFASLKIHKQ